MPRIPSVFHPLFCCLLCTGRRKRKNSEKLPLIFKNPHEIPNISYDPAGEYYGYGGKVERHRSQRRNERERRMDEYITLIENEDYDALQNVLSGGIDTTEWNRLIGAASLHDEASRLELARILLPRLYTADSERLILAGLSQEEQHNFNDIYASVCATRKQYFEEFIDRVKNHVFDSDKVRFLRKYYGGKGGASNLSSSTGSHDETTSCSDASPVPFVAITCKDFITLLRIFTFSHDKIDVTQFMLPKILDLKLHSEWILWEFQFSDDRACVSDMIQNVLAGGDEVT